MENFKFVFTHAQHGVPTSANVVLYEIMGQGVSEMIEQERALAANQSLGPW